MFLLFTKPTGRGEWNFKEFALEGFDRNFGKQVDLLGLKVSFFSGPCLVSG